MPQLEIRADIWGSDRIPHTFINVYSSDGTKTEYGFGPEHGKFTDKIDRIERRDRG